MMHPAEEAEVLRLLMVMGIASKDEVIAWADRLIETTDQPPAWVINISLAANRYADVIESMLSDAAQDADRQRAAYVAMGRLAASFRAGHLTTMDATHKLRLWATRAHVNEEDAQRAMVPDYVADEVDYGYLTEADVAQAVQEYFDDLASRQPQTE
jgi:hypothetical protein